MKYDNKLFAQHLAGMVKFDTTSTVNADDLPVENFKALQQYLKETYPLVFKTMECETVGKCGLMLHWKGTGKSDKLPIMVMAHQDVVPAGDLSAWKHPPFEPYLDEEGVLWGRGSTDCKQQMTYELEALEGLIGDGFVPDHDVYAIFGYNEEIMGGPGAAGPIIVEELKKRGIRFGLVIDEGANVGETGGKKVSNIAIGEKGYADYEFYVEQAGGHAAMPPKHNALGELFHAIWLLEENPMEPVLCPPVVQMFKGLSQVTEGELGQLMADPEKNWDKLVEMLINARPLSASLRTTTTPTMAQGSAQANILPERASVVTNSRILPGQTLEDLEAHFRKVMPENVKFRLLKGNNPPPYSTVESPEYKLLMDSIRASIDKDIVDVPTLMIAGTDSRYYTAVCDNVFRFGGIEGPKSGGTHSVNERLDTNFIAPNVEFFYNVIKNYGKI